MTDNTLTPPKAWTDWAEQGPLEWKFFVNALLEDDGMIERAAESVVSKWDGTYTENECRHVAEIVLRAALEVEHE